MASIKTNLVLILFTQVNSNCYVLLLHHILLSRKSTNSSIFILVYFRIYTAQPQEEPHTSFDRL